MSASHAPNSVATLPKQLEAAALWYADRHHKAVSISRSRLPRSLALILETDMWRMVPDIDLADQTLSSQDADKIVITFRGIGEMTG